MMSEVWVQLDEEYGDPLTIADDMHCEVKQLLAQALGREFILKLFRLLKNAEAMLESCSQAKQVRSDHQV